MNVYQSIKFKIKESEQHIIKESEKPKFNTLPEEIQEGLENGESFDLYKCEDCKCVNDIEDMASTEVDMENYYGVGSEFPDHHKQSFMACPNCGSIELDHIGYVDLEDYEEFDESEELEEASNPDNKEANDLIKKSLLNPKFARDHQEELKAHGITVQDVKYGDGVILKGENGRVLHSKDDVRTSFGDANTLQRDTVYGRFSSDEKPSYDDETLNQKTYRDSKKQYAEAKENLRLMKKRVNLYKKRYGENSPQMKELLSDIEKNKKILDRGVYATPKVNHYGRPLDNLSDDIDYKSYLNAKKMKDRPYQDNLVYNPGTTMSYNVGKNKEVTTFKDLKAEQKYIEKDRERNKIRDKEDQDRIESMKQRAAEEKAARDEYLNKRSAETDSQLSAIRDRISKLKNRNK